MAVDIPKTIADLPSSQPKWIGTPMKRVEDPMLLTGRAEFIDNIDLPGMLHCAILRSPHAHARIKNIDASEALKVPGVAMVLTGQDTAGIQGGDALARDKVYTVGTPVAAVAATSRYIAEDATERIKVEYEPLPAVVDAEKALQPDSPIVFEELGTNVVWRREFVWGDVDEAFRGADQVFTDKFRWHRVSGNPIEVFGVISLWDPVEDYLTCYCSTKAPTFTAAPLAAMLGLPYNRVRVIPAPACGADFGAKGGAGALQISALLSRKAGGRPVKYIQDRLEYLMCEGQAWERHYEGSIAVKKDGTVTGFKVKLIENGGASPFPGIASVSDLKPLACFTGCYAIPVAGYDVTIVASNMAPFGGYRGFGPPPHYVVLEQLMDMAARSLNMDPGEIRRKNFIPPDKFPYIIPSGNEYDSGQYEATLDAVLKLGDYEGMRRQQEEARKQGRYLGIGLVTTIEPGAWNPNVVAAAGAFPLVNQMPEAARVSIDPFGKIVAKVCFPLDGQGQYTFVTQILADYFSVQPTDIRIILQDTGSAPQQTMGPGGSRQSITLTGAILGAAGLLREKLSKVAARVMETRLEDIEFMDGKFRVKGVSGGELGLTEVVGTMVSRLDLLPPDVDPNPEETYVYTAPGRTMPDDQWRCKSYITAANACHLVLLEVDPETGQVKILKYCIADDCGVRLNPANVDGMIQGGTAQGIGAALLEECVYNEDGQHLSATLMDYLLPTIHEVPMTDKVALVTPSPFTGLGAKGTGEGAIHTAPAAIMSAINDALLPLGVQAKETPATPNRLWALIQKAKQPR